MMSGFVMCVPYNTIKTQKFTINDLKTPEINGEYEVTNFSGSTSACGGWGITSGFLVNRLSGVPMTLGFASEDNANFQHKPGISLWVAEGVSNFDVIAKALAIDLTKWGDARPMPVENGLYGLAADSSEKLVKR